MKPKEGEVLTVSECFPNSALDTIQTMKRRKKHVTSKPVEGKINRNEESTVNSNRAVKKRKGRGKDTQEKRTCNVRGQGEVQID